VDLSPLPELYLMVWDRVGSGVVALGYTMYREPVGVSKSVKGGQMLPMVSKGSTVQGCRPSVWLYYRSTAKDLTNEHT